MDHVRARIKTREREREFPAIFVSGIGLDTRNAPELPNATNTSDTPNMTSETLFVVFITLSSETW